MGGEEVSIPSLREGIPKQAEKNEALGQIKVTLTEHFVPEVIIENVLNGKKVIVPLYAYSEIRKVLN